MSKFNDCLSKLNASDVTSIQFGIINGYLDESNLGPNEMFILAQA
jgi:hypothetical protein